MQKLIDTIKIEILTPTQLGIQSTALRHPIQTIKKVYKHFASDSLYRNSIYLMLATLIGALLGLVFWMINTRLFSTEQIGLATALISSVTLISNFSLIGLNVGIIRYLPTSNRKVDKINTVITILLLSSCLMSIVYIFGINYFAPKLVFIRENVFFFITFVVLTIFISLDAIFTSIFIAYRNTKYVLYKNTIGTVLKTVVPFLLVSLGSYAIFASSSIGQVVAALLSFYVLYKFFGHTFRLTIKKDIFLKMFSLSFGNYLAAFIANLPLTLLPIMITNTLGTKQAAFFYIDIMIINLLNTIQGASGQSLFAEGSNNDKELKKFVIKSVKFVLAILVPSVLITIIFGKYLLLFFGKEYSDEGIILLRLLALSTIFTSLNGLLSMILNVKRKVNLILIMCVIGASILLTLTYFALPKGLVSLGYAWLVGEGAISLIYLFIVFLKVR